jgi:uncharacterized damage-inducible protein DinB
VENIIAFSSLFQLIFGYAGLATKEVARMDIQKELEREFESEAAKTRKVLAAIPEGVDFGWKPHPKSMTLGRLASHVTDFTGDWGHSTLALEKLEFPADHKWETPNPKSREELLEKFDREISKTRADLAAITPEKWDQNWKFVFGGQPWIDQSKYQVWREHVINHMIHHRAQLGVFLRLLDAKIPGCYGPSADEM